MPTGQKHSTGLGLTFCKLAGKLMEEQQPNGVESAVGSGSTFWFELPWTAQTLTPHDGWEVTFASWITNARALASHISERLISRHVFVPAERTDTKASCAVPPARPPHPPGSDGRHLLRGG